MSLSAEEWIEIIKKRPLPAHIAIVPDGNGRWAKRRGLPRILGHRAGVETLKKVIRAAGDAGIKYVTVYAFSTENWRRSSDEVSGLMSLLIEFLESGIEENARKGVRIRVIGRRDGLSPEVRAAVERAERDTENGMNMTVAIAFNYGGRAEIIDAVRTIARESRAGRVLPESIDESLFRHFLYAPDIPDPDMVIRSSGEFRMSNFLLWQGNYSELVFSPALWPDFTAEELYSCIDQYQTRDRRFGGAKA
jgi:undecaprenyl diphosphate synthase